MFGASGDIVDGGVEREVDGEGGVGAVVTAQFFFGEEELTALPKKNASTISFNIPLSLSPCH